MSFRNTGGVGGTRPDANMAASLDDDVELNNQDYYSLLNVRKEVRFTVCLTLKSSGGGTLAYKGCWLSREKVACAAAESLCIVSVK